MRSGAVRLTRKQRPERRCRLDCARPYLVRGFRKLKRAIFLTSGAQIAIQLIGLLTGILVARWLGPEGRGELAVVISWASMLTYLGNLGMPVAFAYSAARKPELRHQLWGNGLLVAAVQWLVLGLIGWLLLPKVLASHGPSLVHLTVLYLWVYLPLNLLTLYANAIQQGSGHYARYNAVRLSVPIGYATLLLVFWIAGRINVQSVVLANILSNALTLTLAMALALPPLIRLSHRAAHSWVRLTALRSDLRYGLSAQIGTLQPFSGLQLDVLALTMLSATHDLGLYMAALAGANLLRAQGYALGQVVLPEVAKQENRAEQWRIIHRFMAIAAAGGAAAFIVILFGARPLLRLVYGEAFEPAEQILKLLVAAGAVGAVYRILADGLRGMGRPGVSTLAELTGLGVGVIGLSVGIPFWGTQGAAMAVLAASIASFIAALWLARRADPSTHILQTTLAGDEGANNGRL
jgi:O-antigen/teichoic acid export membrane protein